MTTYTTEKLDGENDFFPPFCVHPLCCASSSSSSSSPSSCSLAYQRLTTRTRGSLQLTANS
jgi:hypothetical protein